jgi:hypothetical protein
MRQHFGQILKLLSVLLLIFSYCMYELKLRRLRVVNWKRTLTPDDVLLSITGDLRSYHKV